MLTHPLSVIVSEKTRTLESQIVGDTIEQALAVSKELPLKEQFHVDMIGLNSYPAPPSSAIHSAFVYNITEQAEQVGLRLEFAHGETCYFVKEKPQP